VVKSNAPAHGFSLATIDAAPITATARRRTAKRNSAQYAGNRRRRVDCHFQTQRGERMNRSKSMSWLAVGIVALVGAMVGFAHAASPASSDEAAIRAQSTNWEKAYNGGDAKAVAALYAEDALLLPPGASGVSGRAAILEFFIMDIAGSKAAGAVFALNRKTDVGVSGNMGWESGTYKVTVKGAVVETGKFLSVSRKKNGKWLYLRDTWNADAPPAPSTPSQVPTTPPAPKK
jgi:ketosteroid isomerase-like protein